MPGKPTCTSFTLQTRYRHHDRLTLKFFNFEGRIMNPLKLQNLRLAVAAAALGLCAVQSAMAANVSVSINQPGVYGRVNIGEPIPQQAWVYQQPV